MHLKREVLAFIVERAHPVQKRLSGPHDYYGAIYLGQCFLSSVTKLAFFWRLGDLPLAWVADAIHLGWAHRLYRRNFLER